MSPATPSGVVPVLARRFAPVLARRFAPLLLLALLAAPAWAQPAPRLRVWTTDRLRHLPGSTAQDAPLGVGSLQKPFVAKAWAAAHPGQAPPQFTCTPGSNCWQRSGHGSLGLARALAVSCNAYYRQLAADTPLAILRETFHQEGFQGAPAGPDDAIGLRADPPILITPTRLLAAYLQLLREPWLAGEAVRQHVLAGLRAAPRDGTAALLGQGGCWAKTGTIPAASGATSQTRGLVVVIGDDHLGTLAELTPGTGRQAAAALRRSGQSGPQGPAHSPDPAEPLVQVRMFDLLPVQQWRVRNLGPAPVPHGKGFQGPGATAVLGPGDWVGPGLLEIAAPDRGLVRRLEGRLAVTGQGRLVATVTRREYLAGVIAGELPKARAGLRGTFGAVVLRFLRSGARHEDADVCDCTHCAWFIGRGPHLMWTRPERAERGPEVLTGLTDADYADMLARSLQPGPSYWSTDCGGLPLSPHALWGQGDRSAAPHPHGEPTPWQRLWRAADIAQAFQAPADALEIQHPDGVWRLVVRHGPASQSFSFDQAHRRIAQVLGWDALPSPADRLQVTAGDLLVQGVGQGHRVGLCLKE